MDERIPIDWYIEDLSSEPVRGKFIAPSKDVHAAH